MGRMKILANQLAHLAFTQYADAALNHGVGVGQYVVMPDHVHVFVRLSGSVRLGMWVRGLKRTVGKVLSVETGVDRLWQPGFFDHLLRNDESYAEKWRYVRDNPVRQGLVEKWEDWPYRGDSVIIDRA